MSCKPQKPTQLAKLKPIAQALPHANFDRMLIHRKSPQIIQNEVSTQLDSLDFTPLVAALQNIKVELPDSILASDLEPASSFNFLVSNFGSNEINVDTSCLEEMMTFVRALNALEDKIADSRDFKPANKYWQKNDLKSHKTNCLNIFDKHESLHTLQAKFEALGNGVTNDLKNRVIRITEIQAFRLRILKELATLACQSSGTDSSPE
ncbi:MAG: hypothetical protein AAFX95_24080 [Cyanobacteria bacterium J06639_16]